MSTHPGDPTIVSFSQAVYELMLHTYPADFRRAYGAHMSQVFRDCGLRAFKNNGLPGMLSLWLTVSLDYFQSVLSEHLHRGVHMSKQRFIRISNVALLLGAAALMLGVLADTFSNGPYDPYNFASRPIDRILEPASIALIPSALLLLSIGVAGLYARFAQNGSSTKITLGLSVMGGILAFIAYLGMITIESESLWMVTMYAAITLFLGLLIFGVLATRQTEFVRGAWLLIFAGIYVPGSFLGSITYELISGNWLEINEVISLVGLLVTSGSLIAFTLLQRQDLVEPQLSAV